MQAQFPGLEESLGARVLPLAVPAGRRRPAQGVLFLALWIGAAPAAPAVGAGLGVGDYHSGPRTVDSSLAPRELSTVAFEQRSTSHCVAFGSSVAEAPSAGLENPQSDPTLPASIRSRA